MPRTLACMPLISNVTLGYTPPLKGIAWTQQNAWCVGGRAARLGADVCPFPLFFPQTSSLVWDPLQFAYRANRSTEDAISTVLHLTLSHLEEKNTYARLLFIDFSSAFNTIIPQQLVDKLRWLNVDAGTCSWVRVRLGFLSQRQQRVKVDSRTSKTISVSTGSPLCTEPSAVQPAHPWLHCQSQQQPHH